MEKLCAEKKPAMDVDKATKSAQKERCVVSKTGPGNDKVNPRTSGTLTQCPR